MTNQPDEPAQWKESWDHHVHAFREWGLISAMSSCRHVSSMSSLKNPTDYSRWCGACLLIEETGQADAPTIAWPPDEDDG
jgi:hypothetical protein